GLASAFAARTPSPWVLDRAEGAGSLRERAARLGASRGENPRPTRRVTEVRLSRPEFDIVIAGAGIVGLATALALSEAHPELRLAVLDKEPEVARHQSSHNSGVVHSGLYYRPGSFRARLAVEGAARLEAFCA